MIPTGYTPRRITRTERAPSRYWFIAWFVLYCAIEYFYPSL